MPQPQKFITLENGRQKLVSIESVAESAGATDANKLVKTDTDGKLNPSVLPTGVGADTLSIPASEDIGAGSFVNIFDDAGTTKARKADASAAGKEANGFILSTANTGENALVYFEGSNNALTALVPGSRYYLSATTAGTASVTAPTADGAVVQYLGVAISATTIAFEATDGVILG